MNFLIRRQNKYTKEYDIDSEWFLDSGVKPSTLIYKAISFTDWDGTSWIDNFMSEEEFNNQVYNGRKLFFAEEEHDYIIISISENKEVPSSEIKKEFVKFVDYSTDFLQNGISKEKFDKITDLYDWFLSDNDLNKVRKEIKRIENE